MNKWSIAILAATYFSLLGCGLFPEASFELARESRLPKWFPLPSGFSRSDVTVTLDYYVPGDGRRTSKFVLLDVRNQSRWPEGRPSGRKLTEVNGTEKGLQPLTLKTAPAEGYPAYEIITVNGITEVIEHRRMEPIFYVTDDPAVLSELGISGISSVASGQQLPCTDAEYRRAEAVAENLRTWDALYRSYKLYGHCSDGDAAEGYSESVARILVEHWDTLPRLEKLAAGNPGFRRFVMGHVDATLDIKDVKQIKAKAKDVCPQGLHSLCAALKKQAESAIDEELDSRQKVNQRARTPVL